MRRAEKSGEYEIASVTVTDLARMLDVHPCTLRMWIRDGRVTPDVRTLGGHSRFTRTTARRLALEMRVGQSCKVYPIDAKRRGD